MVIASDVGLCFLKSEQQPATGIKAVLSKPSAPSGYSQNFSPLVRLQVTFNSFTALIPRPKAIRLVIGSKIPEVNRTTDDKLYLKIQVKN